MGDDDVLINHLIGTSEERLRREELFRAILIAFRRNGGEAVASELNGRIDTLKKAFGDKNQALNKLLS